jgi:hypothetical protein
VDAAWGGAVVFCPLLKKLLAGVELSDSCCINPHKLCGIPYSCSSTLNLISIISFNFHQNKYQIEYISACGDMFEFGWHFSTKIVVT